MYSFLKNVFAKAMLTVPFLEILPFEETDSCKDEWNVQNGSDLLNLFIYLFYFQTYYELSFLSKHACRHSKKIFV